MACAFEDLPLEIQEKIWRQTKCIPIAMKWRLV